MSVYLGLTWDHPRGTDALRAAARHAQQAGGLSLSWDAQSLEGFESHPIEDLASRYDLIVLDHPHLGDAIHHDCLVPIDTIFDVAEMQVWADAAIGQTFQCYRMNDHQWALPLDAATQVRICSPYSASLPQDTWDDIMALPNDVRIALSLAGPHAALTFFSLCAGLGGPVATDLGEPLIADRAVASSALDIMAELACRMDPVAWTMNPIALHEAVASGALDVCPLVYGYAPYGRTDKETGRQKVVFANAPEFNGRTPPGTTLGGTGVCVTRRAAISPELLDHIRLLMSPTAQISLFPANSGQPYHVRAWSAPSVNREYGNFYKATEKSLRHAWVRPRWKGYAKFQLELSRHITAALAEKTDPGVTLDQIARLHADTLSDAKSEAH